MSWAGRGGARRVRGLGLLAVLALATPAAAQRSASGLETGKLLVASRALRDPNFRETVVLLVDYGPRSGALGLVLNRPSEVELVALLPELEGFPERLAQPVYIGGPVEPTRFTVLVRSSAEPESSDRVFADVFRSHSRELLERLVRTPAPGESFRAYAGYAGWAPGQLELELSAGGWHLVQGRPAIVFEDPIEKMWQRLILIGTAELARAREPCCSRAVSTTRSEASE